tara:strand:- start:455 stop:634 length:180 start_codon:yes stop_codon:yes gene_type:complete
MPAEETQVSTEPLANMLFNMECCQRLLVPSQALEAQLKAAATPFSQARHLAGEVANGGT